MNLSLYSSLILLNLLSCYSTEYILDKYMPRMRHRLRYFSHPNAIHTNYIPLYMRNGPNPMTDYMSKSFRPKYMAKRFSRVKRQQIEDDKKFEDLLGSFGGTTDSNPPQEVSTTAAIGTDTSTESIETSTSKSGFYYLLDWNSFFVADDQLGKRVNIRIEPKFGDPKRFLSVTVP